MDNSSLLDCLIAWVKTFNLSLNCDGPHDLVNGIVIAHCLNNIDPDYFNDEWLAKLLVDTNANWRLKLLRLEKILQMINDYYSEVLNYYLNEFEMPNVKKISKKVQTNVHILQLFAARQLISIIERLEVDSSSSGVTAGAHEELSRLLQLVLGCAVNCQRRSEFIKNIMEMNVSTQHMIMTAIEEVMPRDRASSVTKSASSLSIGGGGGGAGFSNDEELNIQIKKLVFELNRVNEQKDDIEQKCERLDRQVSELQDEKKALVKEIDKLNDSNSELNKQTRIKQRLEQAQEDMFKLESEKEKYRIMFEAAKFEQKSLIEKNIELNRVNREYQSLKDEMDVLKYRSERLDKLEASVYSYKIKLEEMDDLRNQMRSLEEDNSKYLERIFQMEEEVKKIALLRSQIDGYKKQIQQLHEQTLGDEMKIKKLEYEYKDVEETCRMLRTEKEQLRSEYRRLRDSHEQLAISAQAFEQTKQESKDEIESEPLQHSDDAQVSIFSSVELINLPAEIKEKVKRLSYENKLLKSKQNELVDERLMLVQSQLDDELLHSGDMQNKLNETSKRNIELECQLNDLLKKEEHRANNLHSIEQHTNQCMLNETVISELKVKMAQMQTQHDNMRKKSEHALKTAEEKIQQLLSECNQLREAKEALQQAKDKEIADLYEKYRVYLEKAKMVIKSLDPKKNQENDLFKIQLVEKDKLIQQLTVENEKLRDSRDKEVTTIASAWYHLGANLNRQVTDERMLSPGSSFLFQQRNLPSTILGSTQSSNTATNFFRKPHSVSVRSNQHNASLNSQTVVGSE